MFIFWLKIVRTIKKNVSLYVTHTQLHWLSGVGLIFPKVSLFFGRPFLSKEDLGRPFPKDPMNQDLNSSDELVLCLHIRQRNNFTLSLDTLLLTTCHKNT